MRKTVDMRIQEKRDAWANTIKGRSTRIFHNIKCKCGIYNISFDLDKEWIMEKLHGKCELSGLDFKIIKTKFGNKKGPTPFSPSIDRIDPSKGYLKSNCRMIIFALNSFKQSLTDIEMFEIASKLFEFKCDKTEIVW